MKLAILLSGGKDSLYASYLANKENELTCAITIKSENKESYMYHTPNIDIVDLQAKAMNIPLIIKTTKGEKEKELDELYVAIKEAKEKFKIKGVITGAVRSQYQASRVQRICNELELYCFNPLWCQDQVQLLNELIENKFEVIIGGIFAYPFEENWLGKTLTKKTIEKLKVYEKKYKINPAGEGGEIETMVLDCPLFSQRIKVLQSAINYNNYAGTFDILKAELIEKKEDKKQSKKKIINTGEEVLIISTIAKDKKLYEFEFIRPISEIITKQGKTFTIKHISEIDGSETQNQIIISGTTIEDNEFLEFKENIKHVLKGENSILGICAGFELMLPEEIKLEEIIEIGPTIVESLNEDTLTENLDGKECYFLHQHGIKNIPLNKNNIIATLATSKGIAGIKFKDKNWHGLQFHPEMNHVELIKEFLN